MECVQYLNSIEAEGGWLLAEPLGKLTSLMSLNLVRVTEWLAAKSSGKGLSGDGRDIARFGCSGVERWGSKEGSIFSGCSGFERSGSMQPLCFDSLVCSREGGCCCRSLVWCLCGLTQIVGVHRVEVCIERVLVGRRFVCGCGVVVGWDGAALGGLVLVS